MDWGPRTISILSIASTENSDSSAEPSVGLLTRIPSTSTCTCCDPAPRILMLVVFPRLPERWISTPGTVRSASSIRS
ncbi:MAG: hypothetical protein A3I03_06185 [Candidatus Rokubacteria bacterium RIFCSPLOWO2_02_FULL_68_19]|nr:MAG: hypothetical protein A3I03_06185 [Candidatus Rokubacteria bacterium RIFCSPLOWO2_02_FULL_68_19]